MKISKLAQFKPYQYLGQCNKVRLDDASEAKWHKMIDSHVKVSMEELMSQCDWKAIVDEDENSLGEFIMDDPEAYFAKSVWGHQDCYYVMTGGFEFIFVRD